MATYIDLAKPLAKYIGIVIGMITKVLMQVLSSAVTSVTTSSFNITATIDTKEQDVMVYIEYGLTTDYGSELEVTPTAVNGIVDVSALLTL